MKTESQYNFFEIEAYVNRFRCEKAKASLSYLGMYYSAMKEDMSSYDPYERLPFSHWTNLCPEILDLQR